MSSVTSLKPSALLEAMDTPSIVVFHAPWCGHCKNLMPVVDEMAQQHSSSSKPMRVYKIDASKYGSEMRAQSADFQNIMDDVPGFPTIVFFGNGQRHVYSGPRTKGAISTQFAAYLNNKLQGGGDNAADELRPEDVRVVQDGMVLFHWNKCGHCKRFMPAWQEFEAWSQSNAENITVGAIECPSTAEGRVLAQEHGVRGFPTIRVFQNGEATDYEGARSLAALRSFANTTFSGASEEEILSASEEEQLSSIVSGGGSAITDHLDRTIKALQQAQNRKQMETAFSKAFPPTRPTNPAVPLCENLCLLKLQLSQTCWGEIKLFCWSTPRGAGPACATCQTLKNWRRRLPKMLPWRAWSGTSTATPFRPTKWAQT